MTKVSLESLDFTHLDEQVELVLAEMSVESIQVDVDSHLNQAWATYDQVSEVLSPVIARKAVGKLDRESMESFRHLTPQLDGFMQTHPVTLYTTERSRTLYEPSLENWLKGAVQAFWNMLKALAEWIATHIKRGWNALFNGTTGMKKVDAKLNALKAMSEYLVTVPSFVHYLPKLKGEVTMARSVQLLAVNRHITASEVEYLARPPVYDQLITLLADAVVNNLPAMSKQADYLILGAGLAKTPADVIALKSSQLAFLNKRTQPVKLRDYISSIFWNIPTDSRPLEYRLAERLKTLPISPDNTANAELHPKRYDELLHNGATFIQAFDKQWVDRFDKTFTDLTKTSRELKANLDSIAPDNQEVAAEFTRSQFGEVVAQFQLIFNGYTAMQRILKSVIETRSSAINHLINGALNEVKAVDSIIQNNRSELTVMDAAIYEKLRKSVFAAVKSSRL